MRTKLKMAGLLAQHGTGNLQERNTLVGQSRLAAAFTLVKCNWGIGMMAMPYMLDQAGTISGVVAFVLSMAVTQLSIARLLDVDAVLSRQTAGPLSLACNEQLSRPLTSTAKSGMSHSGLDYSGIMRCSIGSTGEWLALLSICVSAWGSCIAYLIFIKDNLQQLFGPLKVAGFVLGDWFWVFCALVPLSGLSTFDDVRFLAPISVVGLGCAFTFACVVVAEAFVHLNAADVYNFFAYEEPTIKPATLPLALSIAAFCNEGIVILTPSTRSAMRKPDSFLQVSGWSIVFFTTCYMAVGLSGNIRYQGHVESQLALNFDITSGHASTIPNRVAIILYCLQLIPTYCVVCARALRSVGFSYD